MSMTRTSSRKKKTKRLSSTPEFATPQTESSEKKNEKCNRSETDKVQSPSPVPILDAVVHRMSNLKYTPRSILQLATSPIGNTIAIAREGGSVELVDPNQKFRTLSIIHGLRNREVDCLAWSSFNEKSNETSNSVDYLFGASRDGTMFHLDFNQMQQHGVFNVGGGAILALEALTNRSNRRFLAAACEDGRIRILEYTYPEEMFVQVTSLSVGGASSPVMSLAWNEKQLTLYAGVIDGTIRKFDCRNFERQSWKPSNVRITVENYGKRTPTRVWALLALDDGTVVSGDRLGHVQFWDGNLGTLIQTYEQNERRADVLTLCIDKTQSSVFASGIDSRVVCFKHNGEKWISTRAHRPHTHDVKAFCTYMKKRPSNSKSPGKLCEHLVSGGTDTKLCTYLVNSFMELRPKKYFCWPSVSPIRVAKKERILTIMRETVVDLYRIKDRSKIEDIFVDNKDAKLPEENEIIGSVSVESSYNLVCSAVSSDGKRLAISDGSCSMLFDLRYSTEGKQELIEANKLLLPKNAKSPCTSMEFSPSGKLLICAKQDGEIFVVKLFEEKASNGHFAEIVHIFSDHVDRSSKTLPFFRLTISPDGKWFAAGRNTHEIGSTQVFTLDGFEENSSKCFRHWWSLPLLESPHCSLKFWDNDDVATTLVMACVNNSFFMFDINERALTQWSSDAGVHSNLFLPKEVNNLVDYPVRLAFNPGSSSKFILVSFIHIFAYAVFNLVIMISTIV